MFSVPFLRNLFILALVATSCLPLYTLYVLHPSYHEQLVHETEEESARFASYLVRALGVQGLSLDKETLSAATVEQVKLLQADGNLIKLRFFSPAGEIIFSTLPEEIGQLNERAYFKQIVAKGQIYSKVVRKDKKTADGQPASLDVVETYVPFTNQGQFGGAIEVYYDITSRVVKINQLTLRTTLTLFVVAIVLMVAISLALRNAGRALRERDQAEEDLRLANEDLENRVAERTRELMIANEQLTSEIAERAQAQQALSQALEDSRRDREKLDGILRSVADGLLVTDGKLNVMHMNAAAETLLKVSLEKALGQPIDRLILSGDFARNLQECLSQSQGGQSFDFEIPTEDPKNPHVYQARISPLASDDEINPGVILLIHDVTLEREVDRMKSAFLGMAAHELNTPLTTIVGYTELLSSADTSVKFSPEQARDCLELIHNKALSLSRLVDDLLDISRIESGQPLALNRRDCALNEVLHEVLSSFREKNGRHSFELQAPAEPVVLNLDCGRIQQVLFNLVSNAVKYSPEGGAVRTVLEIDCDYCRILVADEGIGMTADQLKHVFDRFYRADNSNTAVQGVGLGMNIARHIIEAHGGEIRVDSQFGAGTRVIVELPLSEVARRSVAS